MNDRTKDTICTASFDNTVGRYSTNIHNGDDYDCVSDDRLQKYLNQTDVSDEKP